MTKCIIDHYDNAALDIFYASLSILDPPNHANAFVTCTNYPHSTVSQRGDSHSTHQPRMTKMGSYKSTCSNIPRLESGIEGRGCKKMLIRSRMGSEGSYNLLSQSSVGNKIDRGENNAHHVGFRT